MRRDTKAIEEAERGIFHAPSLQLKDEAEAAVDLYLTHLAKHGDDEGRLIVREAATWLRMALNHDVLSSAPGANQWKLVPVEPLDVGMQEAGYWTLEVIGSWNPEVVRAILAVAPSITGEKE